MTIGEETFQPATRIKGSLELICGSMFSGKTEELMRRLRRAEYAKENVITIKHLFDARTNHHTIMSHDGQERTAVPIDNTPQGIRKILALCEHKIDVVGVDEAQFFPREIIPTLMTLVEQGKKVIAAGLDLDFRGEPFGIMPELMARADKITKLTAVCMQCGKEAHFSQRIIDKHPAKYNDPIILVGAAEKYESRCRDCFVFTLRPNVIKTQST